VSERRLRAVAITWLGFAAGRLLVPEPVARAELQVLAVTTLGYGHLLGALIFARRRFAASSCCRPYAAWTSSTAALLGLVSFYGYAELLQIVPWLPVALLGVSIWHGLENDRAFLRADQNGLQLAPLRGAPRELGQDLALTFALGLLAVLTTPIAERAAVAPSLARLPLDLSGWLSFCDLFTLSTGYHIVSWLLRFDERRRRLLRAGDERAARGLVLRLAAVHGAPLALCLGLSALGGSGSRAVQVFLFSPSIYLFWSTLHAAQTAYARRGGAAETAIVEAAPARAGDVIGARLP